MSRRAFSMRSSLSASAIGTIREVKEAAADGGFGVPSGVLRLVLRAGAGPEQAGRRRGAGRQLHEFSPGQAHRAPPRVLTGSARETRVAGGAPVSFSAGIPVPSFALLNAGTSLSIRTRYAACGGVELLLEVRHERRRPCRSDRSPRFPPRRPRPCRSHR